MKRTSKALLRESDGAMRIYLEGVVKEAIVYAANERRSESLSASFVYDT